MYKYLLNQYLKLCSTDKIRTIDSVSSLNTPNNEDKRKLEFLKDKYKSRPSKRKLIDYDKTNTNIRKKKY